jgi:hypothetical protein
MNKYRILIDPAAVYDIREIFEWYEKAQKGLGVRIMRFGAPW